MQTNAWCHDYRHYVGITPKVPTSDNMPINSTTMHWAQCGNYSTSSRHLATRATSLPKKPGKSKPRNQLHLGTSFSTRRPETDELGGLTCQHPPGPSPPHPSVIRAAMGSMCDRRPAHTCAALPVLPALPGLGF